MGSRSQDFNSHGSQTKSRMGKGQNEGGFSAEQIEMYKECFKLMDVNKDGVIDKNDLRGAFDNVGVLMSEGELDGLLGEISGPCTYDNMVQMFQEKMAGEGNDSDDLIIQAFKACDCEGKIDVKMFQHALSTWGDKMSKDEIDDIFGEFDIVRTTCARPRRSLDSLSPRRRRRRRRKHLPQLLRKLPLPRTKERPRRRRRRRPPSKFSTGSLSTRGRVNLAEDLHQLLP